MATVLVLMGQVLSASIPYLRWMVTCMRIPRANVEGTREMPGTMKCLSAQVHPLTSGLRMMRTLAVTAAAAVSQVDQVRWMGLFWRKSTSRIQG